MIQQEFAGWQPKLAVASSFLRVLPVQVGLRTRVSVLRWAGVSIGHGTVVLGDLRINGAADLGNLRIGRECVLNHGVFLDPSERLEIGDDVAIGHQVLIMTSSHEIGGPERRHGQLVTAPVVVENGAWLSSRCVIQPGVTIGAGSIVLAGAVVTRSVERHAVVGGIPAVVRWRLPVGPDNPT